MNLRFSFRRPKLPTPPAIGRARGLVAVALALFVAAQVVYVPLHLLYEDHHGGPAIAQVLAHAASSPHHHVGDRGHDHDLPNDEHSVSDHHGARIASRRPVTPASFTALVMPVAELTDPPACPDARTPPCEPAHIASRPRACKSPRAPPIA